MTAVVDRFGPSWPNSHLGSPHAKFWARVLRYFSPCSCYHKGPAEEPSTNVQHHPLPPPRVILACSQPRARRVCAGLARADVCPCPTHPEVSSGSLAGRRRGIGSRVRGRQSRDSCDSDAFARPRARRALDRIARSRRSAVPYTARTRCRQRGGQLHGIGGSLMRSQSRAVSPRCLGGTWEGVNLRF